MRIFYQNASDKFKELEVFMPFKKIAKTLTLLMLVTCGESGAAAKLNNDQDRDLIDAFTQPCEQLKIEPARFPSQYLDNSLLISCEIARIFNPKQFSYKYAFLLQAHKSKGVGFDIIEENWMYRTLADHYQFDLEKSDDILMRAINGDIYAIYLLSLDKRYNPSFGGKGLDNSSIYAISAVMPPHLAELFFLPTETLQKKYPTDESLLELSSKIIANAYRTDPTFLQNAAKGFMRAINQRSLSNAEFILRMPHELRRNLLNIHELTPIIGQDHLTTIQLLEYSTHEKEVSFFLNAYQGTWWERKESHGYAGLLTLIDYLQSFEKSILGVSSSWSPFRTLEVLQLMSTKMAGVHTKYSQYFEIYDTYNAMTIDIDDFKIWLKKVTEETEIRLNNDRYEKLLAAQILHMRIFKNKYLASDPYFKRFNDFILARPDFIKQAERLLDSPLKRVSYQQHIYSGSAEQSKNIKKELAALAGAADKGCLNLKNRYCKQLWRDLDLTILETKTLKKIRVKKPSVRKSGFDCKWKGSYGLLLKNKFWAGGSTDTFSRWCNADSLAKLVDIQPTETPAVLPQLMTYPSKGTGFALYTNSATWLSDIGQLFTHFLRARENKGAIMLAENSGLGDAGTIGLEQFFTAVQDMDFSEEDKNFSYYKDTRPKAAIAKINASKGNYAKAFFMMDSKLHDLILALKDDSGSSIASIGQRVALASLKHYGEMANIPQHFLQPYVDDLQRRLIASNPYRPDKKIDLTEVKKEFKKENIQINFEDFYLQLGAIEQFISPVGIESILDQYKKSGKSAFANNFGSILALNNADIKRFCKETPYGLASYSDVFSDDSKLNKKLLKVIVAHESFPLRFVRLVAECRLAMLEEMDESKQTEDSGKYLSLLKSEQIQGFKSGAFNVSNPLFFSKIAEAAKISRLTRDFTTAIVTLSVFKHNLAYLSSDFIDKDSDTLRLMQSKIESILVDLSWVIDDKTTFQSSFAPQESERLVKDSVVSLALGFHAPLLTIKTRERLKWARSENEEDLFVAQYEQRKQHFKRGRSQLNKSIDPLSYALSKTALENHNLVLPHNSHGIWNSIHTWLNAEDAVGASLKKSAIINTIYSGNTVFLQVLSTESGKPNLSAGTVPVARAHIDEFKREIVLKKGISTELKREICNEFSEVHAVFTRQVNDEKRHFVYVPSVNLMPIPAELIIGTACGDTNDAILYAGDVLAGFELLEGFDALQPPESFVGVGNPQATSIGFAINIPTQANLRSSNNATIDDLSLLPPLPDAANEVVNISKLFPDSTIFINKNASIESTLKKAEEKNSPALVFATHGLTVNYNNDIKLPSLLSVEDGQLSLFSSLEVNNFDLAGSTVILSACDTASGFTDRQDLYLTGFVESFANAGSDLILATLWPVVSKASQANTEAFFRQWKKTNVFEAANDAKAAIPDNLASLPFVYIYP